MNGNLKRASIVAVLGSVIGLVVGVIKIWEFADSIVEYHRRETSRIAELERRVCALEGGRWLRGDCELVP